MDVKVVSAGFGAGVVGLIVGRFLGTYGGWSPVFSLAATSLGFWTIAIVLSIAFVYLYAYWFHGALPGTPILKGAFYGVLIWILILILGAIFPFFRDATYAAPAGKTVFLSLVTHASWGFALGMLYEAK